MNNSLLGPNTIRTMGDKNEKIQNNHNVNSKKKVWKSIQDE